MKTAQSVLVKRYRNERDYQRDAQMLMAQGCRVTSTTSEQPRSGCMRFILTGGLALFWKPKPVLVVTYQAQE